MIINSPTIGETPRYLGVAIEASVSSLVPPSKQPAGVNEGKSDSEADKTMLAKKAENLSSSSEEASVTNPGLTNVQNVDKQAEENDQKSDETSITQEKAHEVFKELEEGLNKQLSDDLELRFSTDEDTGMNYFQLIEKESGEVIRQYPPDEMIKLVQDLREVSSLLFSEQV